MLYVMSARTTGTRISRTRRHNQVALRADSRVIARRREKMSQSFATTLAGSLPPSGECAVSSSAHCVLMTVMFHVRTHMSIPFCIVRTHDCALKYLVLTLPRTLLVTAQPMCAHVTSNVRSCHKQCLSQQNFVSESEYKLDVVVCRCQVATEHARAPASSAAAPTAAATAHVASL